MSVPIKTVVLLDHPGWAPGKVLPPLAPVIAFARVPKLHSPVWMGIQVLGTRRRYWRIEFLDRSTLILSPAGCLVSSEWPTITLLDLGGFTKVLRRLARYEVAAVGFEGERLVVHLV